MKWNDSVDDAELAKITNRSDVALTQLISFIRNNVEDGEEFNMTSKNAVRQGIDEFKFYDNQVKNMHLNLSNESNMTKMYKILVFMPFSFTLIVFLIHLFCFAKDEPYNNVICLIHVIVYTILILIY
uniref:Uncharacterized protein n=1 Tax=Panagrolaimus sp. JU765 TaxID=591449 RepID=A0AC34RC32_9BILA